MVRQQVMERLATAGCVAADEEAAELIAAAPDHQVLEHWIRRREQGEPLAWITGRIRFGGRDLLVDAGVYVPRGQSEELARRAAAILAEAETETGGSGPPALADLCAGAGAIAHHVQSEVTDATVVAMDIDRAAVRCCRRNGVSVIRADLAAPALRPGTFAVVTAVAPYVPTAELPFLPADVQRYEPRTALDGGSDGLELVRLAMAAASTLLVPHGWFLTEVGGRQDQLLAPALAAAGFHPPVIWADEDGDLRGLAAQRDRS